MSVRTRYIALLVQGAVIWFLAAMFIRFTALAGWMDGGPATMAIFAVSLVSSALGIELIHRTVRGEPGEMIRSAAVIALVGAMLDGLLSPGRRSSTAPIPPFVRSAALGCCGSSGPSWPTHW